MKLHELIARHPFGDIVEHIHPDDRPEMSYIYAGLREATPQGSDITIKAGDPDIWAPGIVGSKAEDPESYALEFHPWAEWLGMEISEEILANFEETYIISSCLEEMTLMGWTEAEIQGKFKEIHSCMQDIDTGRAVQELSDTVFRKIKEICNDHTDFPRALEGGAGSHDVPEAEASQDPQGKETGCQIEQSPSATQGG